LAEADAVVGGVLGAATATAPRLRLLQIPFTGYEWLDRSTLPADCMVCNVFEHETPIAEYILLAILEWQIGLRRIDADFRRGSWQYLGPPAGPFHGEVRGQTVGFIGYGHIAREAAQRTAACGMRNIAVTRRPIATPPPLGWLAGIDALDDLLAESDYVVVSCPLTEATRDLINAASLARMKSTAVLINVARGAIVNEEALYQALLEQRIGGAVIDVWYQYPSQDDPNPRPSRFPFHELDNLIMTPHVSTWTEAHLARRWDGVAANLDRLSRGEALQNVVTA